MGGKSGLRGACVQPCRRMYQQGNVKSRAYSCTDLGLDALVKVLKNVENVASWKIEGRKKGPHYVYYTTLAYRYLRDHGKDPVAKKEALGLLEMALGRERTHFGFLSHRPWHPIPESGQTASGLFVGSVRHKGSAPTIVTREALISGDLVRVGTEDESWHEVIRIPRSIPKGGTFVFKTSRRVRPPSKTPAFLVDRREPELATEIGYLRNELETIPETQEKTGTISYRYPKRRQPLAESLTVAMHHEFSLLQKELKRHPSHSVGVSLWVDPIEKIPADTWVVLPPVVFPKDETDVRTRVEKWVQRGCRTFVLGDPWQIYWFDRPEKLDLWVGPFCNIANPEAMKLLQEFGVKGVIASPELGLEDYMALAEHAPVGVGLPEKGSWPLSISRIEPRLQKETLFESPKKEGAYWVERDGLIWTYPNWQIDFTPYRKEFERAGYRLFFVYEEPLPAKLPIKKRPGLWNLHVGLS